MSNAIFRKVALDRLSSPEQLDQLITVTRPRGWIALLGLICILLTGIVWGFVGGIPLKVNGTGMITASEGVTNVIHPVSGRITDVKVKQGDYVRKGDVIARIEQGSLVDTINTLKKDIELAKYFDIEEFNEGNIELSSSLSDVYDIALEIRQTSGLMNKEQNLSRYKQAGLNLDQYKLDAALLQKDVEEKKSLYENGAISKKEYDDAVSELEAANTKVQIAREELIQEQVNTLTPDEKLHLEYLIQQLETKKAIIISEMTDKLNKAVEELNHYSKIVSQVEGRILEINVEKGNIIGQGESIAKVIRDDKTVNSLEVVLYVSPQEGKKVMAGMDAHVSPTIIKKEDYGYMIGKVISVSEYPTSVQSIVQKLGNEQLANEFSAGSAPIEVRVNLIPDPSTYSGFKWSTSKGPDMKIDSGNICTGSIVIQNRRPVEMVVPYLKKILNVN